jgi:tRNA A-37 threonylcarbamoyl transferase component Bud32
MNPKPPEKIGRYAIDRMLGQGAMGSVYLGRDPSLDRKVAIKTVRDLDLDAGRKKSFLERFRNEAKAAARLSHPSIVQVYDVGEEDGLGPFLVFEYVQGTTLKQILRMRGGLAPAEVLSIAGQIASAIDTAHQSGIIHRDVKPDNILVADDGRAKLADFGVARLPDAALTREGQFLGTPCYAAPETLSSGKYSPRSDIFSFAAVVYELLSGVRAFPGDDAISVAHAVIHDDPIPPSEAGKRELPRALDEVVLQGLAKDARERYGSAMELVDDLERTYAELGLVDGVDSTRPVTASSGGGSAWIFVALLGALALGGVALVFALGGLSPFGTIDVDAGLGDVDAGSGALGTPALTPTDSGVSDDAGVDAGLDAGPDGGEDAGFDAGTTRPMSRLEREEAAKDALDRARRSIEAGDHEGALREIAAARELDPESSDLEEVEALLHAQ